MKIYEWYLDNIYYPIYRFIVHSVWDKIRPGTIKHYYQRASQGYSYQDCWSIDWYLADIIPKMINQLKKNIHGVPGDIADKYKVKGKDDVDMTQATAEWKSILDKIAGAFKLEHEILDHKLFEGLDKKQEKRMQELIENEDHFKDCRIIVQKEKDLRNEGWELFQKYFVNLWD